jgi:hypothetical protein
VLEIMVHRNITVIYKTDILLFETVNLTLISYTELKKISSIYCGPKGVTWVRYRSNGSTRYRPSTMRAIGKKSTTLETI